MTGKYYLISKTITPFAQYKGNAIKLSTTIPYSVEEIVVGKTNNPNIKKTITTFKNSIGKQIEKNFDYSNKPIKNRIYSYDDKTIGNNEFVTSTQIKEYSLDRNLIGTFKEIKEAYKCNIKEPLWDKIKIQTNHFSEDINTEKKVLSTVKIEPTKKPKNETHTFIEYPAIINNKVEKKDPKILQFTVNKKDYSVNKDSIKTSGDIESPKKDSFLGYRALNIEDAKVPLTERFIKERKLDRTGITIYADYVPQDLSETLMGLYSDGTIYFNKLYKFKSKTSLAGIARHEVEHGWQYLLDARNTGGTTPDLIKMGQKAGKIKSKSLQEEADRCSESIKNYVPYYVDYNLYKKNYIEVMANKAENRLKTQYDNEGKSIRSSFKHIPKEYL